MSAKEEDTSTLNVDVRSETENMTVSGDNSLLDRSVDLDTVGATKEPIVYEVRPESGEQFGELYIPKLAATLPVFEGTDEEELALGVGHCDGSYIGSAPQRYELVAYLASINQSKKKNER